MRRRDKSAVADNGIGRSKLSDISYFTDDSSCGNRTYSRDTGKNPSRSKEKSIFYLLGKEADLSSRCSNS
jgi:hypothetical protein